LIERVAQYLLLDRDLWRVQRSFLRSFVANAFSATDRPAWITVQGTRTGFRKRVKPTQLKPLNRGQLGQVEMPLDELRQAPVPLAGRDYSLRGARFFHHLDLPDPTLHLRRVFIYRALQRDAIGEARVECEERLFVASDDPQDLRVARRGATPSLEFFRNATTDAHSAPLISLCRLDERGRIALRCMSLRPVVGEIADLRACAYSPDYYFRSDPGNDAILTSLLTKGKHEPF